MAIVGRSGAGKTYLLQALLRKFSSVGLTVDTIKPTHHLVFQDTSGSDTNLHKAAGARRTVLTGPGFCTVFSDQELSPDEVLRLSSPGADLVLVEGFKNAEIRKIEVVRDEEPMLPTGEAWMTVTSDQGEEVFEALLGVLGKVP